MTNEQGNLAINSENIFPIIKKWLYSDHDIFIREVISNGCDAITKRKKLSLIGETELPDDYRAKIDVEVNPEDKTITFTDNGLGMTSRLSGILDWDFILCLWWPIQQRFTPFLTGKGQRQFTGSQTAA